MDENPIYAEFFKGRALLSGKVFDDPRSISFRKHLQTNSMLLETKPSSLPKASMVERRGTTMTHHVLWMRNEGSAVRESSTYRSPLRAVSRTRKTENAIRKYLNGVHLMIKRLRIA
jgi:hypothetical protein